MRDPATRVDPEVEAAIDLASKTLGSFGPHIWLPDPDDEFKADRGRPASHHRDFWIACTVSLIVERHGLNPTRNRANHKQQGAKSACAIVAAVLARWRVPIEEAAVEKIWQNQRNSLPRFFTNS